MEHLVWRKDAAGDFVAETAGFHLMVRQVAKCHYARFLVLARQGSAADRVLGAGVAVDVAQGMKEAQNLVERFLNAASSVGPLVMLVDDDNAVRDTAADVLRDAGYRVTKVASAEGALRRLERTTRPAVLVSDINLGQGMSGLELAATVHELWPAMGVLLVSGSDELVACEVAGEEFLAKPFSVDQLLERVASIAGRMNIQAGPP